MSVVFRFKITFLFLEKFERNNSFFQFVNISIIFFFLNHVNVEGIYDIFTKDIAERY